MVSIANADQSTFRCASRGNFLTLLNLFSNRPFNLPVLTMKLQLFPCLPRTHHILRCLLATTALVFAATLAHASDETSATTDEAADKNNATQVQLTTNAGDIVLELYADKAPATVANFVQYISDGYYSGTIFHRVIDGFMIQGGGFDADLKKKTTRDPIDNEADNGLKNDKYTIAMARTQDPHSASAQFFINVVNNDFLNHTAKDARGWGYAVFGAVVSGQEVVDKIAKVKTRANGPFRQDVPAEPVIIESARLITE